MRQKVREGLTLIELIIALTIGSMVIAAVLAVLTSANRTQDLGERRADLLQGVRVSLEQMRRDLEAAVTRSNDEQFTFLGTDSKENELPMDSLEFTCVSGDPLSSLLPTGDLLRVQYYIDLEERTERSGLVRCSLRLPLPEQISPTEVELSSREYCPSAIGLNLAYFDPAAQDWLEEWQERTDLPTAVRIVLYVVLEPGREQREAELTTATPFSTVVHLTLANAALGEGQPSEESTSRPGGQAGTAASQAMGASTPTLPNMPEMPGIPGVQQEGGEER